MHCFEICFSYFACCLMSFSMPLILYQYFPNWSSEHWLLRISQ